MLYYVKTSKMLKNCAFATKSSREHQIIIHGKVATGRIKFIDDKVHYKLRNTSR